MASGEPERNSMELSFSGRGGSRPGALVRTIVLVAAAVVTLSPAARMSASEAITGLNWLGNPITGFFAGGGGFTFSPQTNIKLTSLGFVGTALADEPYQVVLWDTNGTQVAQTVITTTSPLRHGTYYEPVQRLVLNAGEKYYLSAAGAQSGDYSGNVLSSSVTPVNGTFSVGPELTYLAAALGTNTDGRFPASEYPATFLFAGGNFEYATRPFVLLSSMALADGQAQVGFTVTGGPAFLFILLEAAQVTGPWTTNAGAILTTNVPDTEFTFTSSQQSEARFFRVLALW